MAKRPNCRWETPDEWNEWADWLSAGLHGRSRWRLPVLMVGMLLANGRRTVTSWLSDNGIGGDYDDYYYFLASVGGKTKSVATQLFLLLLRKLPVPERILLVIDDSPTKRYGPKVEGAGIHRNPTPGPADQEFLYGHIWVTISLALRHPQWGPIGLPLYALLYVREATMKKIPRHRNWTFATKLQLAARLVEWAVPMLRKAGTIAWVVVDGGYAKNVFLHRALRARAVVVGRLRRDAALRDLPPVLKPGHRKRGRTRKYGVNKISLAKRAGHREGWSTIQCTLYNKAVTKTFKSFLATYPPAGGTIRVVLVREEHTWVAFFCTNINATVQEILEAFADRATIEQDFHDVKEVWGTGQQQVRNIWTNVAVYNMNLWMHTLVEIWAWDRSHDELCNRSGTPWDDPDRRPSHADRRKALRRYVMQRDFLALQRQSRMPRKIIDLAKRLLEMAA